MALLTVLALCLGAAGGTAAANASASDAGEQAKYIVILDDAPLASYSGGVPGLAPTSPTVTGPAQLDTGSAASVAYLAHLAREQDKALALIRSTLGRSVEVGFRYNAVLSGFSAELTPGEAQTVGALRGISRVARDETRWIETDAGPAWIGATAVHDGSAVPGDGTRGEGVVVGVIDTGVNHDHPSFADIGGDGFDHTNPRGMFFGLCDPITGVPFCNDKLIGVYDFSGATVGTPGQDDNGHGSHTASTAAGNIHSATVEAPTITLTRQIGGVAPHANLITYKACVTIGSCVLTSLLAAINQATLDQVDVINYSIGGGSSDPWQDLDAQAFLSAREAGIFVAASAGNSGPGAATLGSPADAPWVMGVGASTHNRKFVNSLVAMIGGSATPPADMTGKSVTAGYPASPTTAPIVYAGNPPYNSPLCGEGPAAPTGEAAINPFPPDTFNGQIVVCDRGLYGRVEKSQNVMEGGAGGFVLANDAPSGDSLIADPYPIPGVHITFNDGVTLKAWLGNGTGPERRARITGTTANTAAANGDVMASFSSRGPNPAAPDLVKPDVTAPGVDILAAFNTPATAPLGDPEYGIISGTSMSSPHAAGSAALIRALKPGWSPDEVKSALMSTSFTTPPGDGSEVHGVFKEDASTPADPFDMGAGRVNLHAAGRAGIVLDVDPSAYTAANPSAGGDPKTLNIASMGNSACATSCSWTRTVKSTGPVSMPVTWTASVITPAGMTLTVSPASFTLGNGTRTLTVTANVSGLTPNQWHFATVVLTPNLSNIPKAHFPVAVRPTTGGGGDPDVTVKRLTFHGNLHAADDGCTGFGRIDILFSFCTGPFLRVDPNLDPENPAARWGPVTPGVNGTVARNIHDPNWTWFLTEPTTVRGTMQVQWWASCGGCTAGVASADWIIRVWKDADTAPFFQQRFTATPALPNVPSKLSIEAILPETTANQQIVLQIDPVFIDSQQNTNIYYDSTQACPGAATAPCDSFALMPVVTGVPAG